MDLLRSNSAALSAVAFVPIVGDALAGMKMGKKVAGAFGKMTNKVDDVRSLSKGCLGDTCFTAGTQIVVGMDYDENDVVVYDTVNIEDIQVGDLVYSYNTMTGEVELKAVTKTIELTSDHVRYVTLENEIGDTQTLETTDSHPFWVVTDDIDLSRAARSMVDENGVWLYHDNISPTDNGYWVEAKDLRVGDVVLGANGELSLVQSTMRVDIAGGISVFNLEVEGNHNYFVLAKEFEYGQTCVLVHNAIGYRAVSKGEYDDIIKTGKFRQASNGMSYEGKWFATSQTGAESFGNSFVKRGWMDNYYIVRAEVPDFAIEQSRKNLDQIADAFYVGAGYLPFIKPLL